MTQLLILSCSVLHPQRKLEHCRILLKHLIEEGENKNQESQNIQNVRYTRKSQSERKNNFEYILTW